MQAQWPTYLLFITLCCFLTLHAGGAHAGEHSPQPHELPHSPTHSAPPGCTQRTLQHRPDSAGGGNRSQHCGEGGKKYEITKIKRLRLSVPRGPEGSKYSWRGISNRLMPPFNAKRTFLFVFLTSKGDSYLLISFMRKFDLKGTPSCVCLHALLC